MTTLENLEKWLNTPAEIEPLPVMPVNKNNNDAETLAVDSSESIFKISLPTVNSFQQFNQIITDCLKETIINMAVIVNHKTREYAIGNIAIPKDEVIILKKIIGIFNVVTGKHNETRSGKNIFDIEEALEKSEKVESNAAQDLNGYLNSLKKSSDDD